MVTIKIFLDKRRATREETYPLNFRIYYASKSVTRSTKIYLRTDQWDDVKKAVRKHPDAGILNKRLQIEFADLQSKLLLASDEVVESYLNPKPIIKEVIKPIPTVFAFAYDVIKELRLDNRIGNAWAYENALSALRKFNGNEDLEFHSIDYLYLDRYNKHLIRAGLKHNTAFFYIRTLRAIYNKAIKHKIASRDLYPFNDISLKAEKTKKRAIGKVLVKDILTLDLVIQTSIWHVRNWFMLSFYLMGISFVDLAMLKPESINKGRVTYKRQKTGKQYDIKVVKQAQDILNLYHADSYGYILPIINRRTKSDEETLRLIKDRTRFANKYLKRMAELIETDETITTYTSRHSWATICKKLGYSIEIIAEALGHEYGNKTTAVYLDTFDQEVVDNANEAVANSINI